MRRHNPTPRRSSPAALRAVAFIHSFLRALSVFAAAPLRCIKLHQNATSFTRKPTSPLPTFPPSPSAKQTQLSRHPETPRLIPAKPANAPQRAPNRGPVKGIFQTKDLRSAQLAQIRNSDLQFQATGIRNARSDRSRSTAPTPHPLKRTRSSHTAIRGVCS